MDKGKRKRLARAKRRLVNNTRLNLLPPEILVHIIRFLEREDIPFFGMVCKDFLFSVECSDIHVKLERKCYFSSLSRMKLMKQNINKYETYYPPPIKPKVSKLPSSSGPYRSPGWKAAQIFL